jgi:hypothetical protein
MIDTQKTGPDIANALFIEKKFTVLSDCPGCLNQYMINIRLSDIDEDWFMTKIYDNGYIDLSLYEPHICTQKPPYTYNMITMYISLGNMLRNLPVTSTHLLYKESCKNTDNYRLGKQLYFCFSYRPFPLPTNPTLGEAKILSLLENQTPENSLKKMVYRYYGISP